MNSPVVTLHEPAAGVVQVTMQDRASANGFSDELISGLLEAFARIRENSTVCAVVLTGYDTYFASGGTREGLLQIHNRLSQFILHPWRARRPRAWKLDDSGPGLRM